jgi:hypothetical protein
VAVPAALSEACKLAVEEAAERGTEFSKLVCELAAATLYKDWLETAASGEDRIAEDGEKSYIDEDEYAAPETVTVVGRQAAVTMIVLCSIFVFVIVFLTCVVTTVVRG